VGIGLSCWLLMFLLPRFSSREIQASAINMARRWPGLHRLMHTWHGQRALLIAAVLGGGSGLSLGLNWGLSYGLFYALSAGLQFGLIGVLVSPVLEAQAGDVRLTERLRWTWGSLIRSLLTPRHLRSAVLFASIVLILVGLSYGLFYGLFYGLSIGLLFGLFFGLFFGLSAGLSYWLLLGLFQGISHERVEDQDRQVFNQGIRRSLRNSGIMGVISGGVIGAVGILSAVLTLAPRTALDLTLYGGPTYALGLALSNGLSNGLTYGLSVAQSFGLSYRGWLLVVGGGLLVCAISGGLAVLRHAVLRLLLWRTHTFPWRAAPLLEDAKARILLRRVGGGYSFIHRLLLDYFVNMNAGTPSASPAAQLTQSPPP